MPVDNRFIVQVGNEKSVFAILGRCVFKAAMHWNETQLLDFITEAQGGDVEHMRATIVEHFKVVGD